MYVMFPLAVNVISSAQTGIVTRAAAINQIVFFIEFPLVPPGVSFMKKWLRSTPSFTLKTHGQRQRIFGRPGTR
jgi:hypothetical protein